MPMTNEERLEAVTHFEETDRPWRLETIGFWDETLERWLGEGMPKAAVSHIVAPYLYFQFDVMLPLQVSGHDGPGYYPKFRRRTLKREGNYKIVRDVTGCTIKVFRDGSSTIPEFLEFPVKSMDDLRRISRRLDPKSPGRTENPLYEFMIGLNRTMKWPLGVSLCGLFGLARHMLGFENLMAAYYDDPELVHAIGERWAKFSKGIISRLARKGNVSFVQFWEDMCYRAGPMISPATFKEFMTPYYREVIDHAKNEGLTGFWVDTDGDCTLLIPLFIDVGVNMMWPFEVQAGMDIREVRREHGDRLAILGGLDKRALAGTREDIEREVFEKAPELLRSGGYIPAIDHCVQPEVSFANFKFFLRLLRRKLPRHLKD